MLFSTTTFLFWFLPLTLVAWLAVTRRGLSTVALAALLCASWVSYAWFAPRGLLLLLASIGVNYGLGRVLGGTTKRAGVLTLAIVANLCLLGWFKYAGFFAQTMNDVIGASLPVPELALPLGISFFTLQQVSYLVDVHRGQKAERDPVRYALYISFFPHLIAGPIVLHNELLPQFHRRWFGARRRAHDFALGVTVFSLGLAKKVLISDRTAPVADAVFSAAEHGAVSTPDAWLGVLAYTMQIYFDFSAYSDMAIGLAAMFGFRLPVNFKSPYKATSIIDFWRRWHITLSHFLRIYLYIPLGGNRRGPVRRYVNLLLTMLIGGLWHGAGWTFVVWGFLHGVYLIVNHGLRALRPAGSTSRGSRLGGWGLTLLAVMVAWVFFRAASFGGAMTVLRAMVGAGAHDAIAATVSAAGGFEAQGPARWQTLHVAVIALAAVIAVAMPNVSDLFKRHRLVLDLEKTPEPWSLVRLRWRPSWAWLGVSCALFVASVLAMEEATPFIYFAF